MLANRWLFCYNIGIRCSIATPRKIMLWCSNTTPKKIMLWCSNTTPRKSRNMERTITKRKTINRRKVLYNLNLLILALGKIIVITTIMMFVMLCIAEYCLS